MPVVNYMYMYHTYVCTCNFMTTTRYYPLSLSYTNGTP